MADIITLSIEAGLFHYGLLNFQYKVQLLPECFLMPLLWSFPGQCEHIGNTFSTRFSTPRS